MADDRPVLRIGQSPDPDDAFMWWPLAGAQAQPAADFDTGRFRYEAVPADIETLNCRAEQGELEITALSCAQYPHVARHYMVTNSGASMGQQCGPKIVAGRAMSPEELHEPGTTLAVPGEHTTALAVASMLLGPGTFRYAAVPFDEIIEAVSQERYAAGVVIHEGQLTFEQAGLHEVADLGMWWTARRGLPLPLGINAIRRDLDGQYGPGTLQQVTADLKRCLEFSLDHRDDAMAHALGCGRGLTPDLVERFVGMYVNRWTLDLGDFGRAAVRNFLQEAHQAGLVPDPGEVDFIG
ncbi:MAG: menaquinone biosynthesis family protein [Planctomycetota bacterium]|jgi:1,4-dihydroxy-6-naphthoate synthase